MRLGIRISKKEVYITSLSNTINKYYKNNSEVISGWIQEKEQAYAELEEVTSTSMPDYLKIFTTIDQLGSYGSEQ